VCADHAWPGWSVYSAAKSGIEQLAESLHNELREQNVRVTTVTPSWGATGFSTACGLPSMDKEVVEKMMKPIEMGDLIVKICTTPDHLVLPKVRVQPMIQEINPM
jgi:short-subunit dehydrogenase